MSLGSSVHGEKNERRPIVTGPYSVITEQTATL